MIHLLIFMAGVCVGFIVLGLCAAAKDRPMSEKEQRRCKDCRYWKQTGDRTETMKYPSGKCTYDDAWGIHSNQRACNDFKK